MFRRSMCTVIAALAMAVNAAMPASAVARQNAPAADPPAPPAIAEPTLQQRLDRLCAELEKQRESLHIPGFAIAIVKDDEVILSRGFGVRDLEHNVPVTPETLFAIGSSSKAFTSALCAMLIDEGKMNWDDPVSKHLHEFRLHDAEASEQITMRDLLCHRSGLGRTDLLWAGGGASRDEVLAAVARAEPTEKFREKFQYQNVMFLAAGMAAARAAGESAGWDALMARRSFQPLGMNDSNTSIDQAKTNPQLSLGYQWNEDKNEHKRLPMRKLDSIGPAGAINSNVIDMAQWVRLQLNRGEVDGQRLITQDRFEEMWAKEIAVVGGPEAASAGMSYGLGWFIHDWQGKRVVEHGGNIDGFGAQVSLLPDEKIGYVLLTNVTMTPLQQMSIDLVFDALLGEWKEDGESPLDPETVKGYLGKYRFEVMNADVTVVMKDGKLAVDVPGQMVFTLKEPDESGKRFFEMTDTIAVSFEKDDADKTIALIIHQHGMKFECLKEGVIPPVEISLDDAQKYLSAYHDDENDFDVTVLHRNGRLALDVPGQMVFDLRLPDAEGRWAFRVNDNLAVKFEENEAGEVTGLTFFEGDTEAHCPRVAAAETPSVPTVDDVLALHGRGCGSDKVAGLGNVRITARFDMPNQGIRDGRFTVIAADIDRFVQHIDMGKFGWIKLGVDGESGWSDSSFQSGMELPEDTVAAMRFQHPLMPVCDWKSAFDKIEIARLEKLDNREVIAVELSAGEDIRCTAFVDRETGHVAKIEYAAIIPNLGPLLTTQVLTDWRDVNGVQAPFRWEIEDDLHGKTVVEVENIETNIDLLADAFVMPKRP